MAPATGNPAPIAESAGFELTTTSASKAPKVATETRSLPDNPLPSVITSPPIGNPSFFKVAVTALAPPANEAPAPLAPPTKCASDSPKSLFESVNSCSTRSATGGDSTLAISVALAGATPGVVEITSTPAFARYPAKTCAACLAGSLTLVTAPVRTRPSSTISALTGAAIPRRAAFFGQLGPVTGPLNSDSSYFNFSGAPVEAAAVNFAKSFKDANPPARGSPPRARTKEVSPPPTKVMVLPSRMTFVASRVFGPKTSRAAAAVSNLIVEAGIRALSVLTPSNT